MEKNTKEYRGRNIAGAYKKMEALPEKLLQCIGAYSGLMEKETKRHNTAVKEIQEAYDSRKKAVEKQKKDACGEAEYARKVVLSQLKDIEDKRKSSDEAYKSAYQRVLKSGSSKKPVIGVISKRVLLEVNEREQEDLKNFKRVYGKLVDQENRICSEKIGEAERIYQWQYAEETSAYSQKLDLENKRAEEAKKEIYEKAEKMVADLQPEKLKSIYAMLQANIPAQMNFTAAPEMPAAIEVGYIEADTDEWERFPHAAPLIRLVRDTFSYAFATYNRKKVFRIPLGRSFENSNFNKLVTYDEKGRGSALEYLRAIEMRMFMSIPCGKLYVTMIDPVDSGSNFSMFSCLGDDDKRIISTRIWSDPDRIKEQLRILIEQIAHVHQDCLRGEYKNIVEYNKHVGKNAEPLQALFVADFPRHFDKEAWEMLEKIVSGGPDCGIYTFIAGSREDIEDNLDSLEGIVRKMEQMDFSGGSLSYVYHKMPLKVVPVAMPPKSEMENIYEALKSGIRASDRIIIDYDEISGELTEHPEKWFCFSGENGLDIPVGLEGASRTVQIHLGGELQTQHHALISGIIGSGKSSLLHTIIISMLLRYGPEDVQICLLDFKRGVEFKIYAESRLQNFRVISLDTEAEFGLAVLRYLEQEQAERAQEFHDKNCDNIEKYNEIAEKDPDGDICRLPRIVVVIDEFHEMFADPESEISKECAMLLEQVVRQGRALGIHMVLASQTLPENLTRIYGQMMNRIVLQSTGDSAQCILDGDNPAVNTLINVDPGRGIFNDGGGNKDYNHSIRVAYIAPEEKAQLLARIRDRQDKVFGAERGARPRLLLSTIQDDNENPLNLFVERGSIPQKRELGCPLYLGEEIAMENDFSIKLAARRTQNMLILGSDHKRAELLYCFAAISILFYSYCQSPESILQGEPVITFFDFASSQGRGAYQRGRSAKKNLDIMNELSAHFPSAIRVYGKESLMDGIEALQEEYREPDKKRKHYVIFAGLNRARRLLDQGSAYEIPPHQILGNLVKNGPASGLHFIVWANEPGSFLTFYGDLLPEFDYRLVYDLKEEEYEQVIKSTGINTNYDNNVISYNPDEDNKKVRVYSKPLTGWFEKFIARLEGEEQAVNTDFYDYGEFADEEV